MDTDAALMVAQQDIDRVRGSFEDLAPKADKCLSAFLERLFAIAPEIRYLFPTDLSTHGRRLTHTLAFLVARLDSWAELEPHLTNLGVRHVAYGVRKSDYTVFADSFLWALEDTLGEAATREVMDSWSQVLGSVCTAMQSPNGRTPWHAVVAEAESQLEITEH
jgi:hemoglobin-like flavoprotein